MASPFPVEQFDDPRERARQLLDLDRADFEDSLYLFYKGAWTYIDPAPWVDSWAIDAIAEHLQAVIDGQIRKLLINISPRSSKSGLVSVALLPWTWAQRDGDAYERSSCSVSLRILCESIVTSRFGEVSTPDRIEILSGTMGRSFPVGVRSEHEVTVHKFSGR